MPLVTVIMATYNWAPVLPYSIGSALDQTFSDFELLVIGDGCTDESGEVVAAISDARVHWHNLPTNTGHQSGPNNAGIRQARGDVIAYLGHDDLWLPRHLELLLGAIDEGARIAHASTLLVRPDRQPLVWPPPGYVYRGGWVPPTAMVHTRALAEAVGGWRAPLDTGLLEPEAELCRRMCVASHPPRWVPRLTSVKPPASRRRDVYRDRPSHEQAYWLRRIREADNPEHDLSDACNEPYPYREASASQETSAIQRKLRDPSVTADERIRGFRRFKGLGG
jgi:glycosyltransferase involved in cell wall biosynthesis